MTFIMQDFSQMIEKETSISPNTTVGTWHATSLPGGKTFCPNLILVP